MLCNIETYLCKYVKKANKKKCLSNKDIVNVTKPFYALSNAYGKIMILRQEILIFRRCAKFMVFLSHIFPCYEKIISVIYDQINIQNIQ